jgi:hypothetical protein
MSSISAASFALMGEPLGREFIEGQITAQMTTTRYGRLDCHVDVSPEGVYVATVLGHYDVPVRQVPSDDLARIFRDLPIVTVVGVLVPRGPENGIGV